MRDTDFKCNSRSPNLLRRASRDSFDGATLMWHGLTGSAYRQLLRRPAHSPRVRTASQARPTSLEADGSQLTFECSSQARLLVSPLHGRARFACAPLVRRARVYVTSSRFFSILKRRLSALSRDPARNGKERTITSETGISATSSEP